MEKTEKAEIGELGCCCEELLVGDPDLADFDIYTSLALLLGVDGCLNTHYLHCLWR